MDFYPVYGTKIKWNIIRYEDAKGLLQLFDGLKKTEQDNVRERDIYIGGKFQYYDTLKIGYDYNKKNDLLLFSLKVIGTHDTNEISYDNYIRNKKSFLDILANIFSLCLSLYSGLTSIFSMLYSRNFDKYKILDNIISKQKSNLNKAKMIPLLENKKQNDVIDINKEDSLLEENFERDNKEQTEILYNENSLPRLRFFDFIYNNIYSEKFCSSQKQNLISKCNDIITKYYSIENIIFNQIILENLIEDYKWNKPELKNVFLIKL